MRVGRDHRAKETLAIYNSQGYIGRPCLKKESGQERPQEVKYLPHERKDRSAVALVAWP